MTTRVTEMRAWSVDRPGPMASGPLRFGHRAVPRPTGDELLVQVEACGVCRTDLHLAEGDLAPHRDQTVPGHEVVGRVVARGDRARDHDLRDRVRIAWL